MKPSSEKSVLLFLDLHESYLVIKTINFSEENAPLTDHPFQATTPEIAVQPIETRSSTPLNNEANPQSGTS
ncbi:hypothetical protein HHI36_006047 [Cryptolaemus montrouzieri]|uniref:Uncharacterized protein n=1 Tax=Cryptolaemus montrouzieri TaxID=559131 RepID=A0ABD2NW23_9CUCU